MGYLDPGTSGFIIQVIVGVALGLGVTVKLYWKKVTDWFRNRGNQEPDTVEGSPDSESSI